MSHISIKSIQRRALSPYATADSIPRLVKRGEVSAAYAAAVAWAKKHPNPCAPMSRARRKKYGYD